MRDDRAVGSIKLGRTVALATVLLLTACPSGETTTSSTTGRSTTVDPDQVDEHGRRVDDVSQSVGDGCTAERTALPFKGKTIAQAANP